MFHVYNFEGAWSFAVEIRTYANTLTTVAELQALTTQLASEWRVAQAHPASPAYALYLDVCGHIAQCMRNIVRDAVEAAGIQTYSELWWNALDNVEILISRCMPQAYVVAPLEVILRSPDLYT
jgi:hypothetical protein